MNNPCIKLIRIPEEAHVASGVLITKNPGAPRATRKRNQLYPVYGSQTAKAHWIHNHKSLWLDNTSRRVYVYCFSPVFGQYYWADAITGTLYSLDGVCQTAEQLKLDVSALVFSPDAAIDILIKTLPWWLAKGNDDEYDNEEPEQVDELARSVG